MRTSFKINGHRVPESEFRVLEEALTGACGTPAFADGHLTRQEALVLLTKGEKGVNSNALLQVCRKFEPASILERHGINIAKLITRRTLIEALQQDGNVWSCAPARYRRDPELAVLALQNGVWYYALPESLKKDPYIAQNALLNSQFVLYFSPALNANESFMRAAIEIDVQQFRDAPEALRQNRALVLNVLSRDGRLLKDVPSHLWEDRVVVRKALENLKRYSFYAMPELPLDFFSDPELMQIAALNDPVVVLQKMQEVESPLLKDEVFVSVLRQHWRDSSHHLLILFNAVNGFSFRDELSSAMYELMRSPSYFEHPPRSGDVVLDDNRPNQDAVVQRLGQWFDFLKMPYPAGMFDNYVSYHKSLQSITQFPERFRTIKTMLTCWYNRNTIDSDLDRRPIALALYTTVDHNDAFEEYSVVNRLVDDGRFRVIYEEVSSDTEAEAVLKRVSKNGRRPIHTLIVAGHGGAWYLNLGAFGTGKKFKEEKYLDTSDFKERVHPQAPLQATSAWQALGHYLMAEGNVVLYACSNGYGGKESDNLANAVANVVPRSVTVYSSTKPTNILNLVIMPDLKFLVEWRDKSPYNPTGQRSE